MTTAALFLALLGAPGCDDSLAPPGALAHPPAAVRAIPQPRGLSDAEVVALLTRAADRGDSSAGRELGRLERSRQGPAAGPQRTADGDPDDPSTWGDARIYDPRLYVSLAPGDAYVLAVMEHDGHGGEIDLSYRLAELNGREVQRWGPVRKTDFNPLGKYNRSWMQHSVQLSVGSCGLMIDASAGYAAYYVTLPLPTDLGPVTLPQGRYGEASASDYAFDAQAPCPDPPSDPGDGDGGGGDGGGGGGGHWLVYSECRGYDYYDGGVYLFSIVESCSSYSVWVDAT